MTCSTGGGGKHLGVKQRPPPPPRRDGWSFHTNSQPERPMNPRFDAVVIGMGQAGPSLAARLSAQGMKVAIVERGEFGGTCVNNGCTPTKAMVASAYAAHLASRAADFGVVGVGRPSVDMAS